MAGNFLGIQFSWKAHLQRFHDLIFTDGCSRVALPTGIASYCTHAVAQILAKKVVQNQQAIDRSYLYMYLAKIKKRHESYMIEPSRILSLEGLK